MVVWSSRSRVHGDKLENRNKRDIYASMKGTKRGKRLMVGKGENNHRKILTMMERWKDKKLWKQRRRISITA